MFFCSNLYISREQSQIVTFGKCEHLFFYGKSLSLPIGDNCPRAPPSDYNEVVTLV